MPFPDGSPWPIERTYEQAKADYDRAMLPENVARREREFAATGQCHTPIQPLTAAEWNAFMNQNNNQEENK